MYCEQMGGWEGSPSFSIPTFEGPAATVKLGLSHRPGPDMIWGHVATRIRATRQHQNPFAVPQMQIDCDRWKRSTAVLIA